MENPESVLQSLENFKKLAEESDFTIPVELEEYIHYVAKTGDPVFQWSLVKPLIKEKFVKVISEFWETNSDIPHYPNVGKFHYDTMKTTLLERIEWFKGAPFTIQRIAELLVNPTKEYNRVDKYMRAVEKNIYVVSTREPGMPTPVEETTSLEESFILNGNDFILKSDFKNNQDSELEVDVTNNGSSDDNLMEDNDISKDVDLTPAISTDLSESTDDSDIKSGQTRKYESSEEDQEIEAKRIKVDDEEEFDNVMEQSEQTPDENIDIQSNNDQSMHIEEEDNIENNTSIDLALNEPLTHASQPPKVIDEMELEETIDNKIESFGTLESNTLLITSNEVVSEESIPILEESEKTEEDNINSSKTSSDMELSTSGDVVNEEVQLNSSITTSESKDAVEISNDIENEIRKILEPCQENTEVSNNISEQISKETSEQEESAIEKDTETTSDDLKVEVDNLLGEEIPEQSSVSEEEKVPENIQDSTSLVEESIEEASPIPVIEEPVETEQSEEQKEEELLKPDSDELALENKVDGSSSATELEINDQIEEALIAEDDGVDNVEDVGTSDIDPLGESVEESEKSELAKEDQNLSEEKTEENSASTV